jgi:hypothetical protein
MAPSKMRTFSLRASKKSGRDKVEPHIRVLKVAQFRVFQSLLQGTKSRDLALKNKKAQGYITLGFPV